MVQQMHPGVSGPGGPQVSQAGPMMGGMPPGAGTAGPGGPMPNAHALSHLTPTQAHMFQQQAFPQNCEYFPQPVVGLSLHMICHTASIADSCPSQDSRGLSSFMSVFDGHPSS